MTLSEFFNKFNKVSPREWEVSPSGYIRHRKSGHCPLSWVARNGAEVVTCSVLTSCDALNLLYTVGNQIANAADNNNSARNNRRPTSIRARLLTAIAR